MLSLRNHLPDLSPDALVPALRDPRMAHTDLNSLTYLARYDTIKALEKAGAPLDFGFPACNGIMWSADPLDAAVFNALARCAAKGKEAAAKRRGMQLVALHCGVTCGLGCAQS